MERQSQVFSPAASDQLVVALDGISFSAAQELVESLRPFVAHFEVGLELFTACGPSIIEMIRGVGGRVFLDLKFHDIPSTVAKAVVAAANLGVQLINLHASGGQRMMEESLAELDKHFGRNRPKLIAVTVLTSMETLGDIGVQYEVRDQVVRLAKLTHAVGLDGVSISPMELSAVRQACGERFLIVTSGIRMPGENALDQRRIGGPRQSIAAGANYIVVGRPITQARDPVAVVKLLLEDMAGE